MIEQLSAWAAYHLQALLLIQILHSSGVHVADVDVAAEAADLIQGGPQAHHAVSASPMLAVVPVGFVDAVVLALDDPAAVRQAASHAHLQQVYT